LLTAMWYFRTKNSRTTAWM